MDEPTPAVEEQTAQRPTGVTLYRPAIVSGLFLLNIVVGFSVFVGVVLAYIWRGDDATQEWEQTHFTYLIRTFWVGFVLILATVTVWFGSFFAMLPVHDSANPEAPIAFFLTFFGMFLVWLLLAAWFCTRCVLSLVKSSERKPMPRPLTWLF